MEIVSYNVNGIRAAIRKGLVDWIEETQYDIYNFQETKALAEQVDLSAVQDLGYHAYWHSAEKKGYSGVLTLSKKKADKVYYGMGERWDVYDREGRVLRLDYGSLTVLNIYFPSGSSSEERHTFKMQFLRDLRPYIDELRSRRDKLIVVGDYNVVHLDADIHNPGRKDKPSGFRPEERAWMDAWFQEGMHDAYRQLHPEATDIYSWWSYRAGSRARNKGWRIDYLSVSDPLKKKISDCAYLSDVKHSDHCPVWLRLKR